ncbi:MAG: hypothetical protein EXQ70_08815 [Solirubrobacterales bacterium]|nr:hypothetical protein [Solirubrobacterales bacterium]
MSGKGGSPAGASEPIPGYDGRDTRRLVASLSEHSQVELSAIESYERSHQERTVVFDKLRWLQGKEPFPGYDGLDVDQIIAELETADLLTVKRVRAYERKFGARKDILDAVISAQRAHSNGSKK